jgi:uncharacterized integral membrane protein (TIGR00697 family)
MVLNSFAMLIREAVDLDSNCKYRVVSFERKEGQKTRVVCELLKDQYIIELSLEEIMRSKLRFFKSSDIVLLTNEFNKKTNKPSTLLSELPSESTLSSELPPEATQKSYYNSLMVAFTVLLILANLGATKIISVFGFALAGGIILFPFLYIISDILTEVYGFSASRRVIWTAFFYNCVFCIFTYILIALPPFKYWDGQSAFETIFSTSPRIVLGSLSSYIFGEFLNTTIISYGKIWFDGKYFALRAIISTLFGALLESILFGFIAFYGRLPTGELIKMMILLALVKITYEIVLMPITVRIVIFLKKKEKIDVFEKPSMSALFPKIF